MQFVVWVFTVTTLVHCHTITTYDFTLNEPLARQLPWSIVLSGTTGTTPAVPRRFQTYGCQGRVFISYTAHTGQHPNPQYPTIFDEDTVGHLAEFAVSQSGAVTFVKDVKFPWCTEMGNLFATSDCQIISVLCRSPLVAKDIPGAVDLMEIAKNQTGDYPFGWVETSVKSVSDPRYRIVDQMFLFEFSSGVIGPSPSTVVLVNHAIGGWNFGHWEVALSLSKTVYFVSMKTTKFAEPLWHEGAVTFSFQRGGNWKITYQEWACGTGHIQANRVTFNPSLDKFARYCWTDYNYEQNAPNGIFFSTSGATKRPAELRSIPVREGAYWNGNGGSMNSVATPTGFLASAIGPGANGNPGTIGIINLPGDSDKFNGNYHYYKWLDIPGNTDNVPINNSGQIGFPNLQQFGKGGENSGRFLLGWASGVKFKGVPTNFFIAEIDTDGCVYGDYTQLPSGGWGQDDVWGYSPLSGCVVMPYTWIGNPANPYAECTNNNCTINSFSKVLYITTVCPSGSRSTTKTCKFLPYRDPLPTCSDKILNQDETDIDCGGSCRACPVQNLGQGCFFSPGCSGGGPCPKCGGGQCCRQGYGPSSCMGLGCTTSHCCTEIPLSSIGGNCSVNADCNTVKCVGGVCIFSGNSFGQKIVFDLTLLLVVLLVMHL